MFLVLFLFLALAMPAPAGASHAGSLWATVNICDTDRNPNVLGVRASMPGNGTRQTMWMRFSASYFDRATEGWRPVGGSSRSPWLKVGDARYSRQTGRKFSFDPPAPVTSHVVRGIVEYQWRRKHRVVRRARQKTLGGHHTGRYADPRNYSAGVCEIKFP